MYTYRMPPSMLLKDFSLFVYIYISMCVCVLCFKKTATAQKTNRQKKHETVCAFCLFVVFFHVPAVLHDWDNQGTVHQRCTTCLLPPGQIFISISVSHTCMIFRKMSDSRTCRVLHQLKSPLLIRSEVMSWNSSNHFIKTSPRLFFFLRHLCRRSGCVKSWWSGRSPVLIV